MKMKPENKVKRRMGFIRDQQGIMNRYLREKSTWAGHLENTRNFILSSFTNDAIETVAVLGSGWLLDVPLDGLRARFKRVFLVDIHHPPQIRKKTELMEDVELIEADLSGGAAEQLWHLKREKGSPTTNDLLAKINLSAPLDHINPDAVISVNLLNQLDIILCDFLKGLGSFQQETPDLFRSAIQQFHIQWISRYPGCLITDVMEIREDKGGQSDSKSLLYTPLPEGIRRDRWNWDFDTLGTYHPEALTRMEVQAVEWR